MKIKTAAYCRVSTDREEQEGSYEMQVSYFTDKIKSNPNMELVGIYGDKGKSGLHVDKRPGLKKLIEDCRTGKINLILTKSISRFARNMAECAGMIRELKRYGVNIIFEEQNLNSKDETCCLLLNIFAAIAEEESHSISQHAIQAHEQQTMQGRPFGRVSFGYQCDSNNNWIINEQEAPRVRKAFELAADGQCYHDIQKALDENETNGYKWSQKRLKYMLTNVVYKGDYYSHATVCLIPGRQVENNGYRDRFYITEHHDPIVPPQLFDQVQEMIKKGNLLSNRHLSKENNEFLKGRGIPCLEQ